jgi:hypothetical protein
MKGGAHFCLSLSAADQKLFAMGAKASGKGGVLDRNPLGACVF